jgi:alpha/beta superfamily hydrolase
VPALVLAKELVTQGYNVLLFDFRNSGTSGGEITSVGQYEVCDLLGAIDYIKAQDRIGQHVALLGFSMGASTSILAAAREPKVEALIADSPFADLTDYMEANLPVWSHLPAVPFNRAIMTITPPLPGIEPSAVSPIKEIGKIKGALLLIHGDTDRKIPLANSEQLLKAANSPDKQLLIIKGADHVQGFATDQKTYSKEY